ncbi:putative Dol-P-Glc:Glc(2)Man(9)GlcNAc(2)-PP-Dol alpha-1,2-glucosyltransferase [Tetranychus urticae]|uniref:Dol-P-Glc:Glc(2)Man(9)GlcNAc(2)-PP-Dol alpha-1,2-glucosyltransferase n=1 Tax=Tetranychus urticae TaxID=32264 RepID=T1KW23_TETUR|nr:putative Dol-P-Glc:Glc(2)Man(9)GlcNAc(2)-PP-Dol alpha-1,2-glucosyltransferase [Tetranychus urticae]XP_015791194.1 putative Dol-P-Glc:Glc(2)Man(9)GlcNAc(2)-PP-Dol alpha-1,2-glucosyltransferase [Tetranychus urticae]
MSQFSDTVKTNGSATQLQPDHLFNKIAAIIGFTYLTSLLSIYMLVNEEVQEPYMDEIFHIQQVRSYCVHNFTYWNPKITTPPGLYFTTWVLFKPVSELIAFAEEDPNRKCPVPLVRFINLLFAVGNVLLMYLISSKQNKYTARMSRIKTLVSAVSLSTTPALFFFNFLFYTDSGSLFFILAMYFMHISDRTWTASLLGLVSLFFRQTNIVWCFFFASYSSLKILQSALERSKKRSRLLSNLISSIPQILLSLGGYLITGLLFGLFLYYNQGIVLGDRSAHQATFHLAQIVYFLFFTCLFAAPWILLINNLRRFILYCYQKSTTVIIISIALFLIIKYQNSPHSYLLADNRHYTFYLWRRILGSEKYFIRFSLIPVCLLTSLSFISLLHRKDNIWKCLFILSICIITIPQELLEFRYFVPAFVIWRLNIASNSSMSLTLELAFNIFINSLTLYMFILRPFKWPNSNELQRFMW